MVYRVESLYRLGGCGVGRCVYVYVCIHVCICLGDVLADKKTKGTKRKVDVHRYTSYCIIHIHVYLYIYV